MSALGDSSLDRRRFLTGTAAAGGAAALSALGMFGSPPALGVTQSGLPPIGAEIPCSMLAINTPIRIRTAMLSPDFRGGIRFRVDVNPDDPLYSVRTRIIGFKVTGDGDNGGTITLEQNDVDVDARSTLKMIQHYPPTYLHTVLLPFTMTIDEPESRLDEPLVLTTKDPATLVGQLTQFPPRGDLYRLQNPVDLVLPDDPDTTIATIERFPVKVGGL